MAEIRAANKAMMASMRERSMVEEKRLAALATAQQEQRQQKILRRQEEQKLRILRGREERISWVLRRREERKTKAAEKEQLGNAEDWREVGMGSIERKI